MNDKYFNIAKERINNHKVEEKAWHALLMCYNISNGGSYERANYSISNCIFRFNI